MVTKGDANNTVQRWSIPADGRVGRVLYRVPRAGYLLAGTRTRYGRIFLLLIPALALGIYELVRVWRPERSGDDR